MEINYIKGDATQPQAKGKKIIAHICNDIGGWGKGFVLAISNRWSLPEQEYKKWKLDIASFQLGNIQAVPVEEDIIVVNMIAQTGIRPKNNIPPIRYEALRECLKKLADVAICEECTVHMPRIGAGLAGGDWSVIEQIINEELIYKGILVTVYDWIEL